MLDPQPPVGSPTAGQSAISLAQMNHSSTSSLSSQLQHQQQQQQQQLITMTAQQFQSSITEMDELKLLNFPNKQEDLSTAIPLTLIFALLLVTGCVGNICTAIVIARPKNKYMHTATNYYLFSLAMSDFLFLILGLPQEMYTIWQRYPYAFGESFCIIRGYLSEASTYASILTISAFTIERYVAICHPLWAHTMSQLPRAITSIVIIWMLAAVCAIPPAAELGIITQRGPITNKTLEQSAQCAGKRVIYENMFAVSAMVFFILPMIIVTVLYILIALELRRSSKMNSAISKQNSGQQRQAPGAAHNPTETSATGHPAHQTQGPVYENAHDADRNLGKLLVGLWNQSRFGQRPAACAGHLSLGAPSGECCCGAATPMSPAPSSALASDTALSRQHSPLSYHESLVQRPMAPRHPLSLQRPLGARHCCQLMRAVSSRSLLACSSAACQLAKQGGQPSHLCAGSYRHQLGHHPGGGASSRRSAAASSKKSVIRMLVAVVVSFFICWLPFHAQRLLASYLNKDENQNQFLLDLYRTLTYISGVMYYLSSTINPLLYQLMSAKFRLAFKETFKCSLFKCLRLYPTGRSPSNSLKEAAVHAHHLAQATSMIQHSSSAGGPPRSWMQRGVPLAAASSPQPAASVPLLAMHERDSVGPLIESQPQRGPRPWGFWRRLARPSRLAGEQPASSTTTACGQCPCCLRLPLARSTEPPAITEPTESSSRPEARASPAPPTRTILKFVQGGGQPLSRLSSREESSGVMENQSLAPPEAAIAMRSLITATPEEPEERQCELASSVASLGGQDPLHAHLLVGSNTSSASSGNSSGSSPEQPTGGESSDELVAVRAATPRLAISRSESGAAPEIGAQDSPTRGPVQQVAGRRRRSLQAKQRAGGQLGGVGPARPPGSTPSSSISSSERFLEKKLSLSTTATDYGSYTTTNSQLTGADSQPQLEAFADQEPQSTVTPTPHS